MLARMVADSLDAVEETHANLDVQLATFNPRASIQINMERYRTSHALLACSTHAPSLIRKYCDRLGVKDELTQRLGGHSGDAVRPHPALMDVLQNNCLAPLYRATPALQNPSCN